MPALNEGKDRCDNMIGQVPLQMLIPHTDTVSQTQQNANQRAAVESTQAMQTMEKHVEQARDTVIPKDTLELTQYNYDAKEEGRNKYEDRRKKKKGRQASEKNEQEKQDTVGGQPRVNINIQI